MKFEHTQVWGFAHALRGMRNPKNSWNKTDSHGYDQSELDYRIGPNDMKLAQTLIKAGSQHRKFMRQIFVSVDITAPLFWWKEFDTYKVGTVSNSTSTMHKITSSPITMDCFDTDDFHELCYEDDDCLADTKEQAEKIVDFCECLRQKYLHHMDVAFKETSTQHQKKRHQRIAKYYWKQLIRWLPESWLQTRTVTMTYENLLAMCSAGQRRFHKLNEWSGIDDPNKPNFIGWARTLPYANELIFGDENQQ